MKVLLFVPNAYSSLDFLTNGFTLNGWDVFNFDFKTYLNTLEQVAEFNAIKIGGKIGKNVDKFISKKINSKYIEIFNICRPDLVIIYNHMKFLPETLIEIKKFSKIVFFLGDSPFYISSNKYYVSNLFYADYIICQDSYWIKQFQEIGLRNIYLDFIGYNNERNTLSHKEKDKDIVYIGKTYSIPWGSWGFKKAYFLNQFCEFNFELYGDKIWNEYFDLYPKLKEHFVLINKGLSKEEYNSILYRTKLAPVDNNPGLFNSVHLRLFEALALGAFPLTVRKKDLDFLFDELKFPVLNENSNNIKIINSLLTNDAMRNEIIEEMNDKLSRKFTPKQVVHRILQRI